MKRKLNKKRLFLIIVILIFFILFIVSGTKIIGYLKDNQENKKIQEIIITNFIKKVEPIEQEEEPTYEIDFKTLKNQNPDTVAYLKVNNTNIEYVVVKGNDNEYYLKHNFNKDYNTSGWVFADYHNTFDGSDKNIVIYGHNMRNGSMFGTLKNVLESSWQENDENQTIIFATQEETSYYQVFSTYSIEPEDYYINTIFNSDEEYLLFLKNITKRSNKNYNVIVNTNDKILTLSTCTANGTKRVVLHAKKLEMHG